MDEPQFWELVESSKAAARWPFSRHDKELVSRLSKLSVEEIAAFDRIFRQQSIRAYTWDLWGAAYVMNGGCGDDSFTDFRSWLISLGRERFERALANADSIADIDLGRGGAESSFYEEFGYVASRAHEKKTGKPLPIQVIPYPREPSGEAWEEDADALAQRFPRLSEKFTHD